jgi:hypothetical protein
MRIPTPISTYITNEDGIGVFSSGIGKINGGI